MAIVELHLDLSRADRRAADAIPMPIGGPA